MTEQGRRMSEMMSDEETSGNFRPPESMMNGSRHGKVRSSATEESLLRDQSNLMVKDAFAPQRGVSGRAMTSEFDMPASDAMFDDDDTNNSSSEGDISSNESSKRRRSRVPLDFAAKENKQVLCAKIFVFLVLTASAAVVAYLTFWYIDGEEKEDAQNQVRSRD